MTVSESNRQLTWVEYKTVRQYQSIGDMLDTFKIYGFEGGVDAELKEMDFEVDNKISTRNGHQWLTKDRG
ncbi:MAG: hypothetical protein V3T30_04780 [Thermodesulfobacteriota bacterium]